MKRVFAALAVLATMITPASATGTIECTGVNNDDVGAFVLVGRAPFLAVLRAEFFIGDKSWATEGRDSAAQIVFAQGFQDEESVRADFSDPQASDIVVKLRLFRGFDDKTGAEAGVLSVAGAGVFAVTCESG